MADFTPEQLESYKNWVESLKSGAGEALTPESISEASRESQFLSEQAAKAKKPLGTLGDILPKEDLMKATNVPPSKALVPSQAEAGFKMVGEPTGPNQLAKVKPGLPSVPGDVIESTGKVLGQEALEQPSFLSRIMSGAGKAARFAASPFGGAAVEAGMHLANPPEAGANSDIPVGPQLKTEQFGSQQSPIPLPAIPGEGGVPPYYPPSDGMAESLKARSEISPSIKPITPPAQDQPLSTNQTTQQSETSLSGKSQLFPTKNIFDFGAGGLGSVENLKKVQEEAKQQREAAQIGRLGEIIGSGIAGTVDRGTITKPALGEYLTGQEKEADRKVGDYLQKVEMEKQDPNSPISKGYRDMMKRIGVTIKGDASAASLEKLFPVFEKMQAAEMNAEAKKLQSAQAEYWKQAAHNLKSDKQKDTNFGRASNQLSTLKNRMLSGGGLVGNQIRQGIVGAERIFNTVGLDPRITQEQVAKMPVEKLDSVTKLGIVESAIELNRLLSGSGVPAQKTLQKLIPNNILMGTTSVKDYLTSELNPAQQGQFLRELLKVTARVRDSAKEHNNEMMKKYLSGSDFIKNHDPEGYQNMLQEFQLDDPLEKSKEKPMISKKGLESITETKAPSPTKKTIIKKGYNSKTNQTQLVYSDGSKEIKDGRL